MNSARVIQFIAYLIAALILGFVTLMSLMWGVWGAPIHATHYVALLGALALFAGAFVSLWEPESGRVSGFVGLAGLGTLWLPSIAVLVPQHNISVSALAWLAFLLYFAAVGFSLFYPTPWKWSVPAALVFVLIASGIVGVTATARIRAGEYARPSFAYFRWFPGGEALVIDSDSEGWINSEARALLTQSGLKGKLQWMGSSGLLSASHRVILLAQGPPATSYQLHYPRNGIVIYAFDGARWQMIPANAPTYSSFATLEPGKSDTTIWEDAGGGRQGITAFTW